MELEDLFADPGYRRRGIATALVSCIAGIVRARGAERLEVTANHHALGFYRAAGFIDCGVAETEFGAAPRIAETLDANCAAFRGSAGVTASPGPRR